MISIIMNDCEIDGKSVLVSADRSIFFAVETPQKSRVSEGAAAEIRSPGDNGEIESGCLITVDSEGSRVSERVAGSMDSNQRYGLLGSSKSMECEEVKASLSEVKAEDLRFHGRNCNIDGGNGGVGHAMVSFEEVRVSSEIDRGVIERKIEIRVSKVKSDDLHFSGGSGNFDGENDGTECLLVRSSSELGSNEIKRKVEARVSDLEAEDLQFSGGNGNFEDGKDVKETRVSYGGAESNMEMVEGRTALNYSYSMARGVSTVESSESLVLDAAKGLSYGFEAGDMVWGKVKSHPWWPGHIFNEAFASSPVLRMRREGHVLVAFFGDSSYGWFDLAELIPFEPNYAEKSRQTNSRNFVKAVEEAVDEVSRRSALGLACRCRNPFNFRPSNVQGYFAVDVVDYEPGGVYSGKHIEKARDSFRPAEALSFVKQLALIPRDGEHRSIDWIKNLAVVLAYRKAVFEEFDETYAQAFGMEPVRPPRNAFGALEQLNKVPPRAPLSGPLVIAEALGERKSSGKSLKTRDSLKKDKYQFKRRAEPNEKRVAKQEPHNSSQLQASFIVPSLAFNEASGNVLSRAGDYVLQKRAPAVPGKHPIPAKPEQREIATQERGAVSKLDSVESQDQVVLPTEASGNFPTSQPPAYGLALSLQGGSEEGKMPMESMSKEMDASPEMTRRMKLDETGGTTGIIADLGKSESLGTIDGISRAVGQDVGVVLVDDRLEHDQVMEDSSVGSLSVSSDGPFPGKILGTPSGDVVVGRTTKSHKRPFGEDLSSEKYVMVEKKKKKRKKNKDSGMETSLDHQPKWANSAKDGEGLRKLAGKSIGISTVGQEHSLMDSERKDGISSDSATLLPRPDIGNVDLELTQVVNDLLALALDPFHAIERNSPAVVCHVFLKFRSLVYQKSLVLPPSESETPVPGSAKSVVGRSLQESSIGNAEFASTVEGREASASKTQKQSSRLDDPTKMGRKRSPSDRQEEMSVKRLKKLSKLKLLAMEKKAGGLKTPDGLKGEQKETGTIALAKPTKTDHVKKPELPAKKAEPTALVMKFQPKTSLPSGPQLKARFARFGPLDISGTRIYWKSSTCRVVFKYKSDAQLAYSHATQNKSLFGQSSVKCHLRSLDLPASEPPETNRQRVEDGPDDASQSNRPSSSDIVGEPRLMANQQWQQAVQLKSCLKKPSGDEAGSAVGITKESPRVKFLLGGEGSTVGDQMVVVSSSGNNGSSADGASSSSMAFDVNIKNIKTTVIPPPLLPLPSSNPDLLRPPPAPQFFLHQPSPTPDVLPPPPPPPPPSMLLRPSPFFSHAPVVHASRSHFSKVPHPLHNTAPQFNVVEGRKESIVDISHQMLSLLMRCSDIITDVKSTLGYVPYHPL